MWRLLAKENELAKLDVGREQDVDLGSAGMLCSVASYLGHALV